MLVAGIVLTNALFVGTADKSAAIASIVFASAGAPWPLRLLPREPLRLLLLDLPFFSLLSEDLLVFPPGLRPRPSELALLLLDDPDFDLAGDAGFECFFLHLSPYVHLPCWK